jgi:hypothetical protein
MPEIFARRDDFGDIRASDLHKAHLLGEQLGLGGETVVVILATLLIVGIIGCVTAFLRTQRRRIVESADNIMIDAAAKTLKGYRKTLKSYRQFRQRVQDRAAE